ncbi:MAG: hypothetical protein GY862_30070 [Gammaproteobacteria bacterium]|nr:hypothetical protein [Gammaproteobacteria bacterium]
MAYQWVLSVSLGNRLLGWNGVNNRVQVLYAGVPDETLFSNKNINKSKALEFYKESGINNVRK